MPPTVENEERIVRHMRRRLLIISELPRTSITERNRLMNLAHAAGIYDRNWVLHMESQLTEDETYALDLYNPYSYYILRFQVYTLDDDMPIEKDVLIRMR